MPNPTNPAYNDGSIPFGSRVETFYRGGKPGVGTSLGTYVFETNTPARPTNIIKRKDQNGAPNGSVGQQDFATLSGTVQLATSSSSPLEPGDMFADTFDSAIGSETFVITEVSSPESQSDYKKQSISCLKVYN